MTVTTVQVAERGPQRAGTYTVGREYGRGYFTHAVDPGIGPMGYAEALSGLPLVCGIDPTRIASSCWSPAAPLDYSASCTCGWSVPASRTALDLLVGHAAPSARA